MQFAIGQKVAYPNQGICVVEKIGKKRIGDAELRVYSLRLLSDNSIIFVPVANAETVGIRPIMSGIQCKKLIARLSDDFEPVSCDWKARSREFMKKLQTGDIFEAAEVLKKLTFLSREKKLSFREQTMLDKSRFLIISEVTNAGVADEEALRAEIERLVDIACKKHLKSQPRVMSAAAA